VGGQAGQEHQRRSVAEAQMGHAAPDRSLSRLGGHRWFLPLLERNCIGRWKRTTSSPTTGGGSEAIPASQPGQLDLHFLSAVP